MKQTDNNWSIIAGSWEIKAEEVVTHHRLTDQKRKEVRLTIDNKYHKPLSIYDDHEAIVQSLRDLADEIEKWIPQQTDTE